MQSNYGRILHRFYGVLPDFVREREVLRGRPLSGETFVEIDRSLLVCARRGIARIQVPEDDGLAILGLDVRRSAFVDFAIRGAMMRSVKYP